MQTQKMSLANIKGKLSRAEMKNIMAGSGSGGSYTVNCTAMAGYHVESPGSCTGSQSACQTAANNWCNISTNHCVSCTVS